MNMDQDERNKAIVLRLIELVNNRRLNLLDEVMANDFVMHLGTSGQVSGLDAFKRVNTTEGGAVAFPDFEITINDIFAAGDRVAVRYLMRATSKGTFMGQTATGERVQWAGTVIYRIENNKLVESWTTEDFLSLLKQLGIKDISKLK